MGTRHTIGLAVSFVLSLSAGCVDDGDLDPASAAELRVPDATDTVPKAIDDVDVTVDRTTSAITYHGGPIMLGTTKVYYVWYGDWSGNTAKTILPYFAGHLGGSSYFAINTTYDDASGTHVSNAVRYAGSTSDNYSQGKTLTDAKVEAVVSSAINAGRLPKDVHGVYFVLTSADVTDSSGFCSHYCGWHTDATIGGSDIKYAFVGNPDHCPSSCEEQTTSPNGNAGADGMASFIAHELEETVTDPDIDAWYDRGGNENADRCAWTYGTEYTTSNGAKANMKLGTRDFLIQRNWDHAANACRKSR